MKLSSFLLCGFAVALSLLADAMAQAPAEQSDAVTIPLDTIWGYYLPGTRDIVGIPFPKQNEGVGQTYAFLNKERAYNIEQIRLALSMKPPGEKALPGFVLALPSDSLTLRAVTAPLRGKPNPLRRDFPEGEFTLLFFSHPLSYFTRLRKVERDGNNITVQYQFEPHTTPEATVHFALIPLGKLSAGEYHVDYQQMPIDDQYREVGFEPVDPEAAEIVCRDFSFKVSGAPKNAEPPLEGASLIPLRDIWGYDMPKTRDAKELDSVQSEGDTSHPIIDSLTRIVAERFKNRDKAGPAFVVEGTGSAALENMLKALQDEPARYVSSGVNINLVFYSRFSGYYVHIESVERIRQQFVVTYRFVQHRSRNSTFHFALIPLGELSVGTYEVEMKQSPPIDDIGRRITLDENLGWVVCHDATFYVKER